MVELQYPALLHLALVQLRIQRLGLYYPVHRFHRRIVIACGLSALPQRFQTLSVAERGVSSSCVAVEHRTLKTAAKRSESFMTISCLLSRERSSLCPESMRNAGVLELMSVLRKNLSSSSVSRDRRCASSIIQTISLCFTSCCTAKSSYTASLPYSHVTSNNSAEDLIRGFALVRKIFLFCATPVGRGRPPLSSSP